MGKKTGYLVHIGPEIGLQLGEDEDSIELDLKGSMPRKDHFFLTLFVKVVMDLQAGSGSGVPGLVMGRRAIFDDGWMWEKGLGLGFHFVEEVMVLGLVVPGAPVVEVAVDAVLYFDDHLL